MDGLILFLTIISIIDAIIILGGVIWAVALWTKGVTPALIHLGNGLAKRKIAIFASKDNVIGLQDVLVSSRLFNKKNIVPVTQKENIGMAEAATVYLMHWHDWSESVDEILIKKPDGVPLIVYAPRKLGTLSADDMEKLDAHRNTAITNFRGRLLNDIVTAMITTN